MFTNRTNASWFACMLLSCALTLLCLPVYALGEEATVDSSGAYMLQMHSDDSNLADSGDASTESVAVTVAEEEGFVDDSVSEQGLRPVLGDGESFNSVESSETAAPVFAGEDEAVAEPATPDEEPQILAQATASDLLNDGIWIKQKTGGECTLASAAMLLRRAAILNGVADWQSITDDSIRSVAWTSVGLRWSFTYRGMSVAECDLSTSNEQVLVNLLKEHPEGIVAYSGSHTVLLTDYTNGVLYCADPAYGDRRPLSRADRANEGNITQYWYVSSTVADVEPENGGRKGEGPHVVYRTHVQNVGWQDYRADGTMSGTSGKSLRLEGIEIKLEDLPVGGGITYRTHVQNIGWQDWVSNGEMSGTSGKALRLEAIQIQLTGELASAYDVYYRVHAQNIGWMGWAKNGEQAGTATYAYRLEGIQIVLVKKDGGTAPGSTFEGITQATADAFRQQFVKYRTHVQNVGWQDWRSDGSMAGTSGRSLRLEGIEISLPSAPYAGSVQYCTHVQNIGWQDWVSNGQMSGTSERSLRLEAIKIRLTGEMAKHYDVYYRVHAQNIGWMGWAKNGASAGSAGYSYRLEGIQIVLVKRGGSAPGVTLGGITQGTSTAFEQKA